MYYIYIYSTYRYICIYNEKSELLCRSKASNLDDSAHPPELPVIAGPGVQLLDSGIQGEYLEIHRQLSRPARHASGCQRQHDVVKESKLHDGLGFLLVGLWLETVCSGAQAGTSSLAWMCLQNHMGVRTTSRFRGGFCDARALPAVL